MKPFLFIFLLVCFSMYLKGQCISNPDFAEACETTSNGCSTFSASCAGGWARSHGTPQIIIPNSSDLSQNYAYMFGAANSYGEGMFNSFTFTAGVHYKIQIRSQTYAFGSVTSGGFNLYAATGLIESTNGSNCGGQVATPTTSELIVGNTDFNVGWTTYTYRYTPNANYNQLWIYPTTTSSAGDCILEVDFINACVDPCFQDKYYTEYELPTGESRYQSIYIGSSYGGSATVTTSATADTKMVATNEIVIKDEFESVVTSGSFIAILENCDPTYVGTRVSAQYGKSKKSESSEVSAYKSFMMEESKSDFNSGLTLYPNPANKLLNVDFYVNQPGKVEVQLTTTTGAKVFSNSYTYNIKGKKHVDLDVGHLANGLYFVQLFNTDGSTITKKITKN